MNGLLNAGMHPTGSVRHFSSFAGEVMRVSLAPRPSAPRDSPA